MSIPRGDRQRGGEIPIQRHALTEQIFHRLAFSFLRGDPQRRGTISGQIRPGLEQASTPGGLSKIPTFGELVLVAVNEVKLAPVPAWVAEQNSAHTPSGEPSTMAKAASVG